MATPLVSSTATAVAGVAPIPGVPASEYQDADADLLPQMSEPSVVDAVTAVAPTILGIRR
jgi:hypothetical protein